MALPCRSPGWYQDEQDPTRLRYWNGSSWTSRRRPRPAWTLLSVELQPAALPGPEDPPGDRPTRDGPVEPAALSASSGAPSPAPLGAPGRRPSASRGPAGSLPPSSAAVVPPAARAPYGTGAWSSRRHPLAVAGALATVALMVMAVAVGIVRRGGGSATDISFINQANATCSRLLGGAAAAPQLRPGAGAVPSAASVSAQARRLDGAARRLAALPVSPGSSGAIRAWLSEWHSYVSDQLRYASLLAVAPAGDTAAERSARAASAGAASRADRFATANDLGACVIGARPAASARP